MRKEQLAMTSMLEDIDRRQLERERRETAEITASLDKKYGRMDARKLFRQEYPAGSVVIIAQNLYRNEHYTWHFYRTVLNYYKGRAIFVEDTNEEFPERPPWADTVGHEGERKDIDWIVEHIHWNTGEIVEPIETWWMKQYREWEERR